MSNRPLGFVIAPLGEKGSASRTRSDKVFKFILEPALEECGYEALQTGNIEAPGMITNQIVRHLVNADLVIADLTELNPNVLYELGVRHAVGKPVIHVIQEGQKIPFDNVNVRTVFVGTEVDVAERAKAEIIRKIRALSDSGYSVENPVTQAVVVETLMASNDTTEHLVGKLLEGQNIIRSLQEHMIALLRSGVWGNAQTLFPSLPGQSGATQAQLWESCGSFEKEFLRALEDGTAIPREFDQRFRELLSDIQCGNIPDVMKMAMSIKMMSLWNESGLNAVDCNSAIPFKRNNGAGCKSE